MVPRRMTVTALGLLCAAVTLVVGCTIGAAVAAPGPNGGSNRGLDHVEVDATLGKDGLTVKGHTSVDVGSPGGKGASPRSGPTVPARAGLGGTGRAEPEPAEARAPAASSAPTAAAVAAPVAPPATVAVAPPAPERATPSPPPTLVASATPAAPEPDVAASSSSSASRSAPQAAVDAIVAHAPASLTAVALLLAAALLFLVVQPALDRHDKRLVLGGVDDAPARFR